MAKINRKSIIDIPKIKNDVVISDNKNVMHMLKEKYDLKQQRLVLVEQAQKVRKNIYNLSVQITELEEDIDKIIVEKFGEK